MLIGIWKNIAELEECLNIHELELVVSSARDKEDRASKWLAAVNGIKLDDPDELDPVERVEQMKRKVEAMKQGITDEQYELNELGIDIEIE